MNSSSIKEKQVSRFQTTRQEWLMMAGHKRPLLQEAKKNALSCASFTSTLARKRPPTTRVCYSLRAHKLRGETTTKDWCGVRVEGGGGTSDSCNHSVTLGTRQAAESVRPSIQKINRVKKAKAIKTAAGFFNPHLKGRDYLYIYRDIYIRDVFFYAHSTIDAFSILSLSTCKILFLPPDSRKNVNVLFLIGAVCYRSQQSKRQTG